MDFALFKIFEDVTVGIFHYYLTFYRQTVYPNNNYLQMN